MNTGTSTIYNILPNIEYNCLCFLGFCVQKISDFSFKFKFLLKKFVPEDILHNILMTDQ